MGNDYDKKLRETLGEKRKKIWKAAMEGDDFNYSYKLESPVELSKVAGRMHEVNDWARFWKQPNQLWKLITGNKKAGAMGSLQHDFPKKAEFNSAEAALRYLGEWEAFKRLQEKCQKISQNFPQLRSLCAEYHEDILDEDNMAEYIWQLAKYFSGDYRTKCYLRELDVPYVDTKFIERHKELTKNIFFTLHPDSEESHTVEALCRHLKIKTLPTPNIYLRSLDRNKTIGGLQELMVTAEQLVRLTVNFGKVFFTENKLNGYVFPEVEDGLIIFGAGNGVIKDEVDIPWLKIKQELWYWGDMDRKGLEILSRVREKYPQVRSFLMNRELAAKYQHFMTADTSGDIEMPGNLTCQEQACWEFLTCQPRQRNRLEQEKIPINEVRAFLQEL